VSVETKWVGTGTERENIGSKTTTWAHDTTTRLVERDESNRIEDVARKARRITQGNPGYMNKGRRKVEAFFSPELS